MHSVFDMKFWEKKIWYYIGAFMVLHYTYIILYIKSYLCVQWLCNVFACDSVKHKWTVHMGEQLTLKIFNIYHWKYWLLIQYVLGLIPITRWLMLTQTLWNCRFSVGLLLVLFYFCFFLGVVSLPEIYFSRCFTVWITESKWYMSWWQNITTNCFIYCLTFV